MTHADWFNDTYNDLIVGSGAQGQTCEKSRDEIAHRYADAVEAGELVRFESDLVGEGRRLFDAFVKPLRDKRKRSMKKQCEYLVAALTGNPDDEANIDGMLELAYPVGRADGTDKALRYWSADDWQCSRTERYRNAADAAKAAQDYDVEIVEPILSALTGRGARLTGDLFDA